FSSRRRHTRSKRDWSSDVCSSDLVVLLEKLRTVGTSVTLHRDPDGRSADMTVRFGARRLLLLLDREPDGSALRHLVLRGKQLNRSSGDPVVIVPAWRCLADPSSLVEAILGAGWP